MQPLYYAEAHATGGRTGHGETSDGKVKLDLSTPKELGGDGGAGTNPEQLFAIGYSACFLGALKFVAGQEKVKVPDDASVTAQIGLGKRDDGKGFGLTVHLTVSLPGIEHDLAQSLVDKAEVVCPYAHATRGNIESRFTLA